MAQTHRTRLAKTEQQQLSTRTFMSWQADYWESRCVEEWRRYVRTPIDMVTKWEFLWASAANNRTKETIWKLMHRVLPTKSYIATWGVRINTRCPYCPGREDIYHALIGCNRAHHLWEQLQPMLTRIVGTRISILVDTVALGNHLPNNAEAKALCFYLLTLATALLWQNRNKKIWKKEYQERDLYEQMMDTIRSRLKKETLINES